MEKSSHISYDNESFPFQFKKFVKATSPYISSTNLKPRILYENQEHEENIDTFYLNVCSENKSQEPLENEQSQLHDVVICKEIINKQTKTKVNSDKILNEAMSCAQYNKVEKLKRLIEENGLSVNSTDYYGWSLLMVASFAGSKNIVQYLLSKNARLGRRDSKGNTALSLASKNNHMDILDLLVKKNKKKVEKLYRIDEGDENKSDSYFCELCNFTPEDSSKHETSIVHLFKCGTRNSISYYGIPRNNIGFQMLLTQGWDDSEGLGPDGSGRKYPIKSKEKNNRMGIGHMQKDIDHLLNKQKSDAKLLSKSKTLNLKMLKQKRKNDKHLEKNIRKILTDP